MKDDALNSDEAGADWRMSAEERRQELQRTLMRLRDDPDYMAEAQRIVANYCRDRHREGADAASVIIEIKHLAKPVGDEGHLESLISECIRHYYGDVGIPQ